MAVFDNLMIGWRVWSLISLFAIMAMVASVGAVKLLGRKKANWTRDLDRSVWLLIIFIVVAIFSIGSFIAFIFLQGFVGYCLISV